jgi:hypothetical protein
MNRQDETNDTIERWIADLPPRAPDQVLETVLAELPSLSQQGRLRARLRRTLMSASLPLKLIGAAVIAVAIALVGLNVLPRSSGVGSVAPSPGSSAVPSASIRPSAIPYPLAGSLTSGTSYYIAAGLDTPARLTFTVPASGWAASNVFIDKHHDQTTQVALSTWIVSHVYADACKWEGSLVEAGTTVDELVTALMGQQGLDVSAPTDVVLGGFPAKRVEVTVEADVDGAACDRAFLRVWPVAGPDETGGLTTAEGTTHVVYAVDVDGNRVAVVATHQLDASEKDRAELEQLVTSIRIDPPTTTSSPSP